MRCRTGMLICFWLSHVVFMSSNGLKFVLHCLSVTSWKLPQFHTRFCWTRPLFLLTNTPLSPTPSQKSLQAARRRRRRWHTRSRFLSSQNPPNTTDSTWQRYLLWQGRYGLCVCVCVCACVCITLSFSLTGLLLLVIPFIHPTLGHNPPPTKKRKKKRSLNMSLADDVVCGLNWLMVTGFI